MAEPFWPLSSLAARTAGAAARPARRDGAGAELEPGFNRRGIERLLEQATWEGRAGAGGAAVRGLRRGEPLAFCEAVERLAGLTVPLRGQYLRLVLAELERVRLAPGASAALLAAVGLPGPAAGPVSRRGGRCGAAQADWLGSRTPPDLGGLAATADILDEERADAERSCWPRSSAPWPRRSRRCCAMGRWPGGLVGLAGVRPVTAERLDLRGPVGRAADLDRDLRRDAPGAAYARLQADRARRGVRPLEIARRRRQHARDRRYPARRRCLCPADGAPAGKPGEPAPGPAGPGQPARRLGGPGRRRARR